MADFELAHKKTLQIEGGYVNDATDRGGETYRGIARRFHPDWEGWDYIDEIKNNGGVIPRGIILHIPELEQLVDEFYKAKFWDANNLDYFESQEIAEELFDTGVNMGVRTASKMLQESLNLLNRNERDFKDLKVDGIIGRVTLGIVNAINDYRPLLKTLNGLQFMRYVRICESSPDQEKFFIGWLKRV